MKRILDKVKLLLNRVTSKETTPAKQQNNKRKSKKKHSTEQGVKALQQLKESVEHNGYYSTSVKSLFSFFGYQQRGTVNVNKVVEWLEQEGLHAFPKLERKPKWSQSLKIYKFPVEQLGDLFDSEQKMEDEFVKNEWHKQLGLKVSPTEDRQYKPKGTRDRLDFKAKDEWDNDVVLELKHKGGDKRLVEQAFRYRSLLMTDPLVASKSDGKEINCVIITGIRCLHTARAIHGLPVEKQKKIKWYLYDYNALENSISFIEVTIDDINRHLSSTSANPH